MALGLCLLGLLGAAITWLLGAATWIVLDYQAKKEANKIASLANEITSRDVINERMKICANKKVSEQRWAATREVLITEDYESLG